MAKRWPPVSTISAATMASVSGIFIVKAVPSPGRPANVDGAADQLDVGAHDVHADAAAGDVGDLRGRGEARLEDEPRDASSVMSIEFGRRDETPLQRLGRDAGDIESAPVVGDLDR